MNRIFTKSVLNRMAAVVFSAGLMSAPVAQAHADGVMIFNDGQHDISFVHITPIDWEDWGEDLLGDDTIIRPGEEAEVDLALYDAACVYDVLVAFETPRGTEEVALWEVDLCESGFIAADEWEVIAFDESEFSAS